MEEEISELLIEKLLYDAKIEEIEESKKVENEN